MQRGTRLLVNDSLTRWLRAPGFLMVVAVLLVPPALTTAWVGTHNDDLAVTGIEWTPDDPELGANVTFTVHLENLKARTVEDFNVTFRVGYFDENVRGDRIFRDSFNETTHIDRLDGDATRDITYTWNTTPGPGALAFLSSVGSFVVEAFVDLDDQIAEIEDQNNHWQEQIHVGIPADEPEEAPELEETDANGPGDNNTTTETSITILSLEPREPFAGDTPNITVQISNAGPEDLEGGMVRMGLFRVTFEQRTVDGQQSVEPVFVQDAADATSVDVPAGDTLEHTFVVDEELQVARYLVQVEILSFAHGDAEDDNVAQLPFRVDREITFHPPEPQATAKDFYRNKVLLPIHFTLLVPFIALFYAGGVLAHDRERGNLPYILTRPVPRWQIPVARFAASYVVAALAVLIAVAITYILLLGTPRADSGYFWWPLAFSALILLAYSGLFTFIGVWSDRPYLVGLLYVLGFETAVAIGQSIIVNGRPLIQDWFVALSLNSWVRKLMESWDPAAPFGLTAGADATPVLVLLGVAVVGVIAAGVTMHRREFTD